MWLTHALEPAQLLGYVALVLGISAFLQKRDRRLRFLNASQSLVYCVHFAMLGNPSASASCLVSSTRSFISLRSQSPWWVVVFVALNLTLGMHFATGIFGWLPVVASCFSTGAIFLLEGIPLRLVLLGCTFLWLANNVHSHSIGGTILEVLVGTINTTTILRLALDERKFRRYGGERGSSDFPPPVDPITGPVPMEPKTQV